MQEQLPGPVSDPGRDADDPRAQRLSAHFAHPPTSESGSGSQQVVSDRCDRDPGGIGVEHSGGHMRQGTVFQFRIDLLDDRVLAVHVISNHSVETVFVHGGEERVVAEQVEQGVLSSSPFGLVELMDAADHQPPGGVQGLLLRT